MEDNFWYILNNPACFNDIIYRWFNKSTTFSMFPYCESFFRLFRLTGRTTNALPPMAAMGGGMPRSTSPARVDGKLTLLEEIAELPEDE